MEIIFADKLNIKTPSLAALYQKPGKVVIADKFPGVLVIRIDMEDQLLPWLLHIP